MVICNNTTMGINYVDDVPFRYPPYNQKKKNMIKRVLGMDKLFA